METMRRLFDPDHADRTVPSVIGAYFVWAAFWLWRLEGEPSTEVFYDWLWPWVFLAAGVLGIAYAAWPQSKHLAAWSAALMAGACVSRAWAVLASAFAEKGLWVWPEAVFRASTWLLTGFLISLVWVAFLMPLHQRRAR